MITKEDCMPILVQLDEKGVPGVNVYLRKLFTSREVPVEVLKFIAENQGFEAVNFYEMLRKRHNQNKSPLYTNILNESTDNLEAIVTLTCLLTQIMLYSKKMEGDRDKFFKEIRAAEITETLNEYVKNGDIARCKKLLKVVKSDLLVLEYLNGRREMN